MTVGKEMKAPWALGFKTHECDLSSEDDIHAFAAHFKNQPVDLLLNIAGTEIS